MRNVCQEIPARTVREYTIRMDTSIRHILDERIKKLLEEDAVLSDKAASFEIAYSGLKDIDESLKLASLKITIAAELMKKMERDPGIRSEYFDTARKKAQESLFIIEELPKLAIDDTDRAIITESPEYVEVRKKITNFLLAGGGVFFESRISDRKKSRLVSRIMARAIRRWTVPDDQYVSMPKHDSLPPFLRTLVDIFVPWLRRDYDDDRSEGINEGEEEEITSEKLKLPLSQAVFYLENEVLPALERDLAEAPGDPILQVQIGNIKEQIETLGKMKYFPRSIPVFPEKGFYTDSMTSYTNEGEIVINVRIPVSYASGTRISRMQEMIKGEIARKLCGTGISRELDEEYAYLKDIESGMRGNSRTPSLKLDIDKAFSILKMSVPALRQIENKEEFKNLVAFVMSHGEEESRKRIESIMNDNRKSIGKSD